MSILHLLSCFIIICIVCVSVCECVSHKAGNGKRRSDPKGVARGG